MRRCEAAGLPFAPVTRPEDLETDPHLLASGGLVEVTVAEGRRAELPTLPLRLGGHRAGLFHDVPTPGEHSREILTQALGMGHEEIEALERQGAVA